MKDIELVQGNIREAVTIIFDDHLFDVDGARRVLLLNEQISATEKQDLDLVSRAVTCGLQRAINSYFPLRRLM